MRMRRSFGIVVACLGMLTPNFVWADDAIKRLDSLRRMKDDWEQMKANTEKQLKEKQAELQKARDAADIDARVQEMEKAAKENEKELPKGIKDAVKAYRNPEDPEKMNKAGKDAWKMFQNWAKSINAEYQIPDIAADVGGVETRVAELQKQVTALEKDLAVENAVI